MEDIQKIFISCVKNANSKNFKKLYKLSSPRLFAVLLRILRQEETAQDCLQEVYMKIWRNLPSYSREKGNAMSWMSIIARNHALDTLKRKNIVTYSDDLSYVASDDKPISHELIAAEQGSKIKDCLKKLKPEQEHCILQAYYEGYTYQQIADEMGRPVSTIKTWVIRSMPVLKNCLEKLNG